MLSPRGLNAGVGVTMQAMKLRGFQKEFLRGALAPGVDTACLCPWHGATASHGWALTYCPGALLPATRLYIPGAEYLLASGSIEQARIVYRFLRSELEPQGRLQIFGFSVTQDRPSAPGLAIPAYGYFRPTEKRAMGIVGYTVTRGR